MEQSIHAQIIGIEEGDRVKVMVPSMSDRDIVGTILGITESVVELSTRKEMISIPVVSIEKLYVTNGEKKNTGKGFLVGAVSGGFILGLTAAVTNPPPENCNQNPSFMCGAFEFSAVEAFALGAVGGILVGGATGAIIGVFTKTDRWEQMPLSFSAGLLSSSQTGVGFSPGVSFRVSLGNGNE
ncbi:MAG: hypothetical protein U5K69_03140 [Balneolaceae bacterium]|nr:hypothetical protein [Balneolaceae bacterium]